jgi:hypothetical protein
MSFCKRNRRGIIASPFPIIRSLRLGTLNSILRAVAKVKGIEKEDILEQL